MPKSAAGVLFIQESIVVFKIHSRSPILDSANRSGQEVHEDEQGQVEKDEEPEIQPVGVFRKPVHPGLRCLILVPPSSFERAPPFPDTVGTRRRLADQVQGHEELHLLQAGAHAYPGARAQAL